MILMEYDYNQKGETMIGIIGAMAEEVDALKEKMTDLSERQIAQQSSMKDACTIETSY